MFLWVHINKCLVELARASLDLMHFGKRVLEVTNANLVVRRASHLLGPVVDGVELSNLVLEANVLEDHLNLLAGPLLPELRLVHADLIKARWE